MERGNDKTQLDQRAKRLDPRLYYREEMRERH